MTTPEESMEAYPKPCNDCEADAGEPCVRGCPSQDGAYDFTDCTDYTDYVGYW
jgi:hypothetical protein